MPLFYDNNTQDTTHIGEFQRVERVYAIRFSECTNAHSMLLDKIYRSLPEFKGYVYDGLPYWFGVEEDSPPFLWASVEPSGLLVCGMLTSNQWLAWDTQFRQHLLEFPVYEV
jgi:hypothetical protein